MNPHPQQIGILGAGGHATVAAATAQAMGLTVAAFFVDDAGGNAGSLSGTPVLPVGALAREYSALPLFAGIGDNELRARMVARFPDRTWVALVHPHAHVDPMAHVAEGAFVCAGCVVQPYATVAQHAVVNTGASVDHHCIVEAFAHVAPGARMTGHATLGERALLGAGAIVIPSCRVGAEAVVAAGSSVTRDVAAGSVVAGIPAVLKKKRSVERGRLYLSPPDLGRAEAKAAAQALAELDAAPGPRQPAAFEREFAGLVGADHAVALASGTAALHLALRVCGVGPGDEVLVPTFTFCASVNPILYLGATPVFLDSERTSWNVDPDLLEDTLRDRDRKGRPLPRALVLVHIYGQSADLDAIVEICARYGVDVIEDAAEALGASHRSGVPGTLGRVGIYSLNTNKIVTATGGGMLVTADARLAAHARKLAAQARDDAPHYQHSEVGYNYRLSNVLAAIGRAQLPLLSARVAGRRIVFDRYRSALAGLPGVTFAPEAPWGLHSRWLTCLLLDSDAPCSPEQLRLALEANNIEARPLWKPMHLQPAYERFECVRGEVAEDLFERGLCLPSGSTLSEAQQQRVTNVIRREFPH